MKHLKMLGVVAVFVALAFGFVSCETGTNGHDETPAEAEKTPGTGENPDGKQPGGETPVSKKTVEAVTFTTENNNDGSVNVTMATATEGAVIWYTTDGTEPDSTKTKYTDTVKVTVNGTVIKAIATADGYENSPVKEETVKLYASGDNSLLSVEPYRIKIWKKRSYENGGVYQMTSQTSNEDIYDLPADASWDLLVSALGNEYDGYTFMGFTETTEDIKGTTRNILNVFYDIKVITLTFYKNANDSEAYETRTGLYGEKVLTIPDPKKDGYVFNYWTTDGSKKESVQVIYSESKTYIADWHVVENCNISYQTVYQTAPSSKSVSYSAKLTSEELPKLLDVTNYAFQYWADANGNRVYPGDEVTTDLSLTAVWLNTTTMIGTKAHPDRVGDFIFTDGSALSYYEYRNDNSTLTDARKEACIAVVFYAGADDYDEFGEAILGVGLKNISQKSWCLDSAPAYKAKISSIYVMAPSQRDAQYALFDKENEDVDGRDNLKEIKKIDSDFDKHPNLYPAWEYALNYATSNGLTGDSSKDWYIPSLPELCELYQTRMQVNYSLNAVAGNEIDCNLNYWSSSQSDKDSSAWFINFYNDYQYGGGINESVKNTEFGVCCIKAF